MNPLRGLSPSVRPLLDENFRAGDLPTIDASQYEVELSWDREVDIDPLLAVIDEAMRRFRHEPDKSDAWLAPRVHATLRLTRREAADKRIWYWLNVVAKPDYVRWRSVKSRDVDVKSRDVDWFMGEDSKNALGRLWWAAELTRNGKDYSETASILRTKRFFTSWQSLDAIHHRAATIAVCRFARNFHEGKGLTEPQSERLAKVFNLKLGTLSLDALAPNPPVDMYAVREWCEQRIDETKYMDDLPEGPDEEPVAEESIAAVTQVLETLANEIKLTEYKRRKVRTRTDGQLDADEDQNTDVEQLVEITAS